MYLIPLNQLESVELVIHALRAAAGQAECSQCPAYRVCTRQCLTIAEAVERLLADGQLPSFGEEPTPEPPASGGGSGSRLKVVK